jgi:hypothetical protein
LLSKKLTNLASLSNLPLRKLSLADLIRKNIDEALQRTLKATDNKKSL